MASTASSADEDADLEDVVVVDLDTDKLFPLETLWLPPPPPSACVLAESNGPWSPPPLLWEFASV